LTTPSTPNKDVVLKRKGRPPKALLEKKNPVGRPKGEASIINEYKRRMLNSPKSQKVLDSIFNAALNDDHKNQAAAWKLLMDRMLPVAAFEQEVQKNGGKSAITINISGIVTSQEQNTPLEDIEYSSYQEQDE